MKKYKYEIVIFILNAIYMILELIASRVLSPYFGSSNLVWTSVIGIILLSTSLGNYLGGIIADKNGNKKTLSPLQIRQKASHQPQQRHKGTYIINSLYTIFISHASQYSRSNTGNSKSETKEQPGNQPQLIG